ncbi:MAG: anti-sigma factor [Bacteroidota bacterium]
MATLIGSIILNISYFKKYDQADKELAAAQEKLTDMARSNKEMKDDMGIVQNKYSMPVGLKSVKQTDDAAKIFWMQNTGDVYIDPSTLPDAPQGKQYQLWAIVNDKPVDAGMIITSKAGDKYRIQKMKSFGVATVQAFAITLEKEGGNPTPTMDQMVVMGKL